MIDDEEFENEEPRFDELEDDARLEGGTMVACPYCGEIVAIEVDTGGGAVQDYVEDCPVCCQPWNVHVRITRSGEAEVSLEEL